MVLLGPPVTGGGTPVERYAERPGLDERGEAVTRKIACARLSLQRELIVEVERLAAALGIAIDVDDGYAWARSC